MVRIEFLVAVTSASMVALEPVHRRGTPLRALGRLLDGRLRRGPAIRRGDTLPPSVHVLRLGVEPVTRDWPAAVAAWARQLRPRGLRVVLGRELVVDPAVRFLHTLAQSYIRRPAQVLADLRVVAVPTRDAA